MPWPPRRFPDDVPTLTRGDVTLRAHRLEDADAVVEQCTDPDSVRWTTVPLGYDRAMALDWIGDGVGSGWRDGTEHLFAIEATHPDGVRRFSGSLSLRDEGDGRAEVAFGLHPAVRGQGVMATALDLLLAHGFDDLDLQTVVWWAEVGNAASRKVAWRAGFTFGGMMRRWLVHRGSMVDAWVATLHRDDPRTPPTPWFQAPDLLTERLHLRPLGPGDVDRVVEGCGDPRTQHWLDFLPSPYTRQDAVEYVHTTQAQGCSGTGPTWAVTRQDDDLLLAAVGIPRVGRHSAEIGYWTHPDARGTGVMTEAVAAVSAWALSDAGLGGLGKRRVHVKVADGNSASRRVAEANGFVLCGRETAAETARDGTVVDMLLLERVADPR
ncbi:GNAT family N-acetyltransferase [Solicola sp. PLA-1-18]|uniref:GNAT family N-acetyltransferase n=1 Tax=Solicola sp. PLA-1-18 TaxID=3380532 RepID=UPI003B7E9ED8